MEGDRPPIRSRTRRLRAYLRHNWSRMAVDVALLATWLLVSSAAFDWFALPTWLFYLVLFLGVVVYTRVTPPWERPYRSSD